MPLYAKYCRCRIVGSLRREPETYRADVDPVSGALLLQEPVAFGREIRVVLNLDKEAFSHGFHSRYHVDMKPLVPEKLWEEETCYLDGSATHPTHDQSYGQPSAGDEVAQP